MAYPSRVASARTHRWEYAPGEQKCYRCGCMRRIITGVEFTEYERKNNRPLDKRIYEYSMDRNEWTEQIPNCK